MTAPHAYDSALSRGIVLWLDGDRLRFRAPSGALDPQLRDQLKEHRSGIVDILRARDERGHPLSYGQRALLYMHEISPEATAYNSVFVARLACRTDPRVLRRALDRVVARHPMLRARFGYEAGDPVQLVDDPSATFEWSESDVAGETLVEKAIHAVTHRPLDVKAGPIGRAHLLRVAGAQDLLVLTVHHLCCDLRSIEIVVRDIERCYAKELDGVANAPVSPGAGFREYVDAERAYLASTEPTASADYWAAKLRDVAVCTFPTDRPRGTVQTFSETWHEAGLSLDVVDGIRRLAIEEGTTAFTVGLAAFSVLLARARGEANVVIGLPVEGRDPRFEDVVGYFVNSVAVTGTVTNEMTFREVLANTRAELLESMEHSAYPFPLIAERAGGSKTAGVPPVFQVAFVWNKSREAPARNEHTVLEPVSALSRQAGAPVDVTLLVQEHGADITFLLDCGAELYDDATIRMLGDAYSAICGAVVKDPDLRVGAVALLAPDEMVHKGHCSIAHGPAARSEPELLTSRFAWHVRTGPQRSALEWRDGQLTYQELDLRSGHVAAELSRAGAGPGVPVAALVEHSANVTLCALSIWRSGAVYMPIEPSFPDARIQEMISAAQPAVLVTTPDHETRARAFGVPTIVLTEPPDNQEERPALLGPAQADPAYLIFTSGSVGPPKGVTLTHAGLANVVAAQETCFQQGPGSRILQFFSCAFDASVFEIAMSLGAGATLYAAAVDELPPGPQLAATLRDRRITTVTVTPTVLAALGTEDLPDLSCLITGGEPLSAPLVDIWQPGRRMFNAYGPTEATIWTTVMECSAGAPDPPIGHPIAGVSTYVLDEQAQPVPYGIPGELVIGGAGVGLGYLNPSGAGESRFVPDPFRGSGRMYRTGDLARMRSDGALEFVGRTDDQVKIRGYRVELAEIEHAVREVLGVREVAVVPHRSAAGGARLVAFFVPSTTEPESPAWRAQLRRMLPEYMVPSVFAPIDRLPLTNSDKVDRPALERLAATPGLRAATGDTSRGDQPTEPMQAAVAQAWCAVLERDSVGLDDHFLDVGGTSLMLSSLCARLTSIGPTELTVIDLIEHATVRAQAALLSPAPELGGA